VDFEQGLNYAIRQIRAALGDDADSPRFLETLPKRGYRFIAPLQKVAESPTSVAKPTENPDHKGKGRNTAFRVLTWMIVAGSGLVLAAILIAKLTSFRSSTQSPRRPVQSIAVLPLVNLSADVAQEYFTDGLLTN